MAPKMETGPHRPLWKLRRETWLFSNVSHWGPPPVPGPPRDKWGPWTGQCGGPLAIQGHTHTHTHTRAGGRTGEVSRLSLPLFLALSLQVFVVELLGRRVLLLLGFSICCTACCVLTAALALQVRKVRPGVPRALVRMRESAAWGSRAAPTPAPAAHRPLPADIPGASRWRCL